MFTGSALLIHSHSFGRIRGLLTRWAIHWPLSRRSSWAAKTHFVPSIRAPLTRPRLVLFSPKAWSSEDNLSLQWVQPKMIQHESEGEKERDRKSGPSETRRASWLNLTGLMARGQITLIQGSISALTERTHTQLTWTIMHFTLGVGATRTRIGDECSFRQVLFLTVTLVDGCDDEKRFGPTSPGKAHAKWNEKSVYNQGNCSKKLPRELPRFARFLGSRITPGTLSVC